MAKTTKKTQPRLAVKKSVTTRTEAPREAKATKIPLLENLKKINLIPVAVLLVATFILVALFLFLRKNLIVASVNGQPVTRWEIISLLERQSGKQVADSLISKILVQQEAARQKVNITPAEIDAEVAKIEKQLKGQGSDLSSVLSLQGMTRSELEEQIRLRLVLEKLLAGKTKVSDKEVADYIEANRANFPENLKEAELNKTVREQLESQKLTTEAQKLLDRVKKEAKIKYYLNY